MFTSRISYKQNFSVLEKVCNHHMDTDIFWMQKRKNDRDRLENIKTTIK